MTDYYSIVTGNWKVNTNWSLTPGGGSAGAYPVTGDKAIICQAIKITTNESVACKRLKIDGGELEITGGTDVILDAISDSGNWQGEAQLYISNSSNSKLTHTGSATQFAVTKARIVSASASPTYPWYACIEDIVGKENRTFEREYLKFEGCLPYLGNDTYKILFSARNYASTVAPSLTLIPPLVRESKMDNFFIEGRKRSIIYDRGQYAGAIVLDGWAYKAAYLPHRIAEMKESGQRLAFVSTEEFLPACRIESFKPHPKKGDLFQRFSLTLVEDY